MLSAEYWGSQAEVISRLEISANKWSEDKFGILAIDLSTETVPFSLSFALLRRRKMRLVQRRSDTLAASEPRHSAIFSQLSRGESIVAVLKNRGSSDSNFAFKDDQHPPDGSSTIHPIEKRVSQQAISAPSISNTVDYDGRCTKMAIFTCLAFITFNWLAGKHLIK